VVHEANHTLPLNAEFKSEELYLHFPLCAFMVCIGPAAFCCLSSSVIEMTENMFEK
jgi:hypothetical protein